MVSMYEWRMDGRTDGPDDQSKGGGGHLFDEQGSNFFFLQVPEGQTVTIDSDILSARDADTDVLKLTYIVNRNPRIGKILKNGLPAER